MVTFCSTNRFRPVSQRHAPCWEMQLRKVELESVSDFEGWALTERTPVRKLKRPS